MKCRIRRIITNSLFAVGAVLYGLYAGSLLAQNALAFPSPIVTGVIGLRDLGAVNEITAFSSIVNSAQYSDLTASGTIVYGWSTQPGSVTLYTLSSGYVRLDTSVGNFQRSLRIRSSQGSFSVNGSPASSLQVSDAAVGLFGYSRLLAINPSDSTISLEDKGLINVAGFMLHLVTLEASLSLATSGNGPPTSVATDFYFDPVSHLPLYSIDNVIGTASPTASHVRTISYSAWQQVQGVTLPTAVTQALDGQPLWALQFTQLSLNTGLTSTTFSF